MTEPALSRALEGVRVVDLTRNLAGPFCTMLLGDLGADVIKVERPGQGDDTRSWRPPAWNGHSATFLAANRNKRSICVDLDDPEGQQLLRRLIDTADVVIESFKPGSLASRGLDAQTLRAARPALVCCSISAYGQDGPKSHLPGYDPVLQAATGIMDVTGYPDQPAARLGIGAIDLGTALWAAVGIQAALRERGRTGVGMHLQASLFETSMWWMSYHLVGYLATGSPPSRQGTATPFIAPYEIFPTAEGDLMICAANDGQFQALAAAVGLADLATDPRFDSNPARVSHRSQLREVLVAALGSRTAVEWEGELVRRGVPCSTVNNVSVLADDAQVAHLGMLGGFAHSDIPELRLVQMPLRASGQRGAQQAAPPNLGEHTDEVLAELGIDEASRARWRERGVVA